MECVYADMCVGKQDYHVPLNINDLYITVTHSIILRKKSY